MAERRADPETGIVWTLDILLYEFDGSEVVHLKTSAPSRHTTRPFATWNTWRRVTDPLVARVPVEVAPTSDERSADGTQSLQENR